MDKTLSEFLKIVNIVELYREVELSYNFELHYPEKQHALFYETKTLGKSLTVKFCLETAVSKSFW